MGMVLFYGLGRGWGTSVGLVTIEFIAMGAFMLSMVVSKVWLHFFLFGPLEWVWRILTYGRFFKIVRGRTSDFNEH